MSELDDILYGEPNSSKTSVKSDPPDLSKTSEPKLYSQAERVIAKFGGPVRLAHILAEVGVKKDPSVFYRWTYRKGPGGTGGRVPSAAWDHIFAAARAEGVVITAEDLDPRPRPLSPAQLRAFPPRIRRKKGTTP